MTVVEHFNVMHIYPRSTVASYSCGKRHMLKVILPQVGRRPTHRCSYCFKLYIEKQQQESTLDCRFRGHNYCTMTTRSVCCKELWKYRRRSLKIVRSVPHLTVATQIASQSFQYFFTSSFNCIFFSAPFTLLFQN